MTDEIAGFLSELRAQSSQVELIDRLEQFIRKTESAADGPLEEFMQAVSVIVGRSDRSLKEKVDTVCRLCVTPDGSGHA